MIFWSAFAVGICIILGLVAVWARKIGFSRAILAALCRSGWLALLVLCFFPQIRTDTVPQSVAVQTIRVLVDDSDSMIERATKLGEDEVKTYLTWLEDNCRSYGCQIRLQRLSEFDPRVRQGYSPLYENLQNWLFQAGTDPWIFLSDGADWQPSLTNADRSMNQLQSSTGRGKIIGFGGESVDNIWIDKLDLPAFSFDQRPFMAAVAISRSGTGFIDKAQRLQVQLKAENNILASTNVLFQPNERNVEVQMTVPSLPKGRELIRAEVLPVPGEAVVWDNEMMQIHEVLPNTIGLLHLLGSPSWDGRFLRRYLKSEPKFDLISFFILRDRWDSQAVNERELSLIPFPVERLFNEELPNFKSVAIQNFALYEFLQPEFQENLVKFVEDGGGLLFLGGPRALQSSDIYSSALRKILPFEVDAGSAPPLGRRFPFSPVPVEDKKSGAYFDPELKYRVEFARPDEQQRALASVYDDWSEFSQDLQAASQLKGLHRTDQVKMKDGETTVLLEAVVDGKLRLPLVVASYPGKGRALWVFSDSLWRLAFDPNPQVARSTYDRLLASAMNWLLRNEMRQPLLVREFRLARQTTGDVQWTATLMGPVARYFSLNDNWQIQVCGEAVMPGSIAAERTGSGEWRLRGTLQRQLRGGEHCQISLQGNQEQFGMVNAGSAAIFPMTFLDSQLAPVSHTLESYARRHQAKYMPYDQEWKKDASNWLDAVLSRKEVIAPAKTRISLNYYWPFESWLGYLLAMALPLEVLVRRWHKIAGGVRRRKTMAKAQMPSERRSA